MRDTAAVTTYAIYAALLSSQTSVEDVAASLSETLRPGDESICVWRNEKDATVVRVSSEQLASVLDEALREGLRLAQEAAPLLGPGAAVLEVVAMDDEGQLRWTPPQR